MPKNKNIHPTYIDVEMELNRLLSEEFLLSEWLEEYVSVYGEKKPDPTEMYPCRRKWDKK